MTYHNVETRQNYLSKNRRALSSTLRGKGAKVRVFVLSAAWQLAESSFHLLLSMKTNQIPIVLLEGKTAHKHAPTSLDHCFSPKTLVHNKPRFQFNVGDLEVQEECLLWHVHVCERVRPHARAHMCISVCECIVHV